MKFTFLLRIIAVVMAVTAANSYAESEPVSIIKNKDVDACTDKSGVIDSECLSDVSKRAEMALNSVYQQKLKEIAGFDFSQWWMGEKQQREEMKKSFIRSQELWLKYRQDYCKAASAGAEGVDGYGAIALSCQVNMAVRRTDEIRMVHPNLSDD